MLHYKQSTSQNQCNSNIAQAPSVFKNTYSHAVTHDAHVRMYVQADTQMHHTRTPLATLYSLCCRFSKSQKSSIHPGAFIPFGSGPRNCIGMRLAHMEAKMALIEVLSKFKICKAPETKVIEKILLILINDYVPGSAIQLYYSTVTIITLNTPIIAGSTGVGTRSCNGL